MEENYQNQPLDLSYLIEMVGNDVPCMIEIFDTFVEQTPYYLVELKESIEQAKWEQVANLAHKIKPTYSYIGRADVKEFVQTMELNARKEINVERLAQDIALLEKLTQHIYHQIEEAKQNLNSQL
ncbi:Hpt domain-containing protein [Pedobacter sp. MW01-1-1]|uniref:Hpt domain-containing protein n=1 Tax=Pedobacter sp. MW01-1-1 TaxID=3383027 RepID=UPI003FEFBAF3